MEHRYEHQEGESSGSQEENDLLYHKACREQGGRGQTPGSMKLAVPPATQGL